MLQYDCWQFEKGVGLKKELSWFEGLSIGEKLISWVELNWVEKGVELSWNNFWKKYLGQDRR